MRCRRAGQAGAPQAAEVPDGHWAVWLETSYANVWSGTWHTAAIQREFGRARQPLAGDVLRTAEFRYPDEDFHRFDLEGWRADLWVTRGLPGGMSVSLRVPSLSYGAPHWDAIAEEWHTSIGLPNANRDLFPRGGALLYLRGGGRTALEQRDVETSGVGDVALSAAVPLGSWLGAAHRAAAVGEAKERPWEAWERPWRLSVVRREKASTAIEVRGGMVKSGISVDDINKEEGFPASCSDCKHSYVTWDKDPPYGCKAMGFKSRTYLAQEVRNASGMACQLFERKGSRTKQRLTREYGVPGIWESGISVGRRSIESRIPQIRQSGGVAGSIREHPRIG